MGQSRWRSLRRRLSDACSDAEALEDQFHGGTLASENLRLGIDPSEGLVFPSDAGTMLSSGNFRRRQLKDAKEAARKLDPSFPLDLSTHGLRHSYAMTPLRMGATNYQVGQELGHSKGPLGSTAAYTHVDAERANPIAARMSDSRDATPLERKRW